MTQALSREVEVDPQHAALLIIDVQNYTARRDGGEYRDLTEREIEERFGYFFCTLKETTLPNLQRLQAVCRKGRVEVLYTVIESLTPDGRDRSLDYKISGLHVPKGSWNAQVLDGSLRNNRGYARQRTTAELVSEIERLTGA